MFVGRSAELAKLERLYESGSFQMVVVYGRRRVGKTALLGEFGKGKRALYFTALDQTDKDNLGDFSRAIYGFFGFPATAGSFSSWEEAFGFVADRAAEERILLVFDEFPYAAERNKALPSILQIAIDHSLKSTKLFLVLCGSNQGFMESEVLGRKSPLYGRRTAQMKIEPLGYREAALMLPGLAPQEQFAYYGCFGGVPYYLEQVSTSLSLEENLAQLYFDSAGVLFDEPYGLLRQEFKEPALYASILRAVAGGANRPNLVADETGIDQTTLPKYLRALCDIGVIQRIVPICDNPERSKRGIYRISDACYDFWFRFVMPRTSDIQQGLGDRVACAIMGERLDEHLGRRFERLCLEWLVDEARAGRLPLEVTRVGTWWGPDPATRMQTDIDVVAADPEKGRMIIGECKYRNSFNETEVLESLTAKAGLVKGYEAAWLAVFSKRKCTPKTRKKAKQAGNVMLVTLDEMYS